MDNLSCTANYIAFSPSGRAHYERDGVVAAFQNAPLSHAQYYCWAGGDIP